MSAIAHTMPAIDSIVAQCQLFAQQCMSEDQLKQFLLVQMSMVPVDIILAAISEAGLMPQIHAMAGVLIEPIIAQRMEDAMEADKTVETSVEQKVEKTVEQEVKKAAKKTVEQEVEKTVEQEAEKTVKAVKKTVEQKSEKTVKAVEKTAKAVKKTAKAVKKAVKAVKKAVKKTVETPVETPFETPFEQEVKNAPIEQASPVSSIASSSSSRLSWADIDEAEQKRLEQERLDAQERKSSMSFANIVGSGNSSNSSESDEHSAPKQSAQPVRIVMSRVHNKSDGFTKVKHQNSLDKKICKVTKLSRNKKPTKIKTVSSAGFILFEKPIIPEKADWYLHGGENYKDENGTMTLPIGWWNIRDDNGNDTFTWKIKRDSKFTHTLESDGMWYHTEELNDGRVINVSEERLRWLLTPAALRRGSCPAQ